MPPLAPPADRLQLNVAASRGVAEVIQDEPMPLQGGAVDTDVAGPLAAADGHVEYPPVHAESCGPNDLSDGGFGM